jgi:hypothetical protein
VSNAQQRPAGDIADAGGFNDDGAGPAAGEARVPCNDIVGDEAILGRPPRTIAGTRVRCTSVTAPTRTGAKSREFSASSREGTRPRLAW